MQTLWDSSNRRWWIRAAMIFGLAAGLAVLVLSLAATADAQGVPPPPNWFYGTDADDYTGSTVEAFDQDGEPIESAGGDLVVVDSDGSWSFTVLRDTASRVSFRLTNDSGAVQTQPQNVVDAALTEVPITQFTPVVMEEPEEPVETQSIRVIARLHPTRELRTLEFNIRVDGVDVDPPPRARYLTPSLAYNRWLQSSVIDAGDGYEVRVIACKQDDDDVVFGVRVEGHDDIVPPARRLSVNITHNRWLRSSIIEIPPPGDNADPIRMRADEGCTASAVTQ